MVLDGRLDETKEEPVTKVFERLMNRGFCRIAVDCTKLIYLNSHGISSFVSYIDEARARGGDMKFFGMSAESAFVMERLGLSNFVQTFAKEDEALKAFELPIDEYMSRGALAEYVSTDGQSDSFYHLSYCTAAQKIHEEDRVYFESKWHARNSASCPASAASRNPAARGALLVQASQASSRLVHGAVQTKRSSGIASTIESVSPVSKGQTAPESDQPASIREARPVRMKSPPYE
jgi:anti-anti-sigma factor